MAHLLCFSRNRCTTVETPDPRTLVSTCRLQDNLTDAWVRIEARLPELEIVGLDCAVNRAAPAPPDDARQRLAQVLGMRVGPGMLKIIKGLVGEDPGMSELSFMLEECCHGVILSLTKKELAKAPREPADSREFFATMVRKSIRLYNRCAAFAPGSSVVEGLEPPSQS